MKNKLFPVLFALPVTAGICGALLRASQLINAYDFETGILRSGEPVTYGFISLCVISVLMAVIAAFLLKRHTEKPAKSLPRLISLSLSAGAILILIHACMIFLSLRENFDTTQLILGLFSVYTAVALLVMGKYHMAERDSTAYCIFTAVPSFWACFLLILTFREKISDPVISNYVPLMFSYISILFFSYSMCAHILGKDKRHIAVFSCFVGIFFILTETVSPIFSGEYISYSFEKLKELMPQLAFLLIMPTATAQIVSKN